jgi:hypothetical protein
VVDEGVAAGLGRRRLRHLVEDRTGMVLSDRHVGRLMLRCAGVAERPAGDEIAEQVELDVEIEPEPEADEALEVSEAGDGPADDVPVVLPERTRGSCQSGGSGDDGEAWRVGRGVGGCRSLRVRRDAGRRSCARGGWWLPARPCVHERRQVGASGTGRRRGRPGAGGARCDRWRCGARSIWSRPSWPRGVAMPTPRGWRYRRRRMPRMGWAPASRASHSTPSSAFRTSRCTPSRSRSSWATPLRQCAGRTP